jgi:outer membrane lipoprotein-sorting protein
MAFASAHRYLTGQAIRIEGTLMIAAVLVTLAAVGGVQQNEAEKLFRDLEARLTAAKAVRVVAETDIKGSVSSATVKLTLLYAPGNKADARLKMSSPKQDFDFSLIADGKRMRLLVGPDKAVVADTPEWMHEALVKAGTRMGMVVATMLFFNKDTAAQKQGVESQLPISDFQLGQPEQIDGRATQVLHYRSGPKGKGTLHTLWLDAKSLLPVKRADVQEATKSRSVEVYREFTLNPQVDAAAFELPK